MDAPTSDTCVMCGREKACSRDHVPPKCIFPDPRPGDLVTVPACTVCNMHRSGLDEQFKVFLGLTVGYHLDGDKSYRVPVLRTLAHNRRLRSDILASMRRVVIQDPTVPTSQSALAIPLNKTAHDTVVERTVTRSARMIQVPPLGFFSSSRRPGQSSSQIQRNGMSNKQVEARGEKKGARHRSLQFSPIKDGDRPRRKGASPLTSD